MLRLISRILAWDSPAFNSLSASKTGKNERKKGRKGRGKRRRRRGVGGGKVPCVILAVQHVHHVHMRATYMREPTEPCAEFQWELNPHRWWERGWILSLFFMKLLHLAVSKAFSPFPGGGLAWTIYGNKSVFSCTFSTPNPHFMLITISVQIQERWAHAKYTRSSKLESNYHYLVANLLSSVLYRHTRLTWEKGRRYKDVSERRR